MSHGVFELGRVRVRVHRRTLGIVLVLTTLLGAGSLLLASVGEFQLSFGEVLGALFVGDDPAAAFIVRELRLPRILLAVLTGAALGAAGALIQAAVRNPLASPEIIGIESGAASVGVFWLISGLPLTFLPLAAGAGAAIAAALVMGIGLRRKVDTERMVLVGIGVNAVADALRALLLVKGGVHDASRAYRWVSGSLYTASWDEVVLVGVVLLLSLPLVALLSRQLRVLSLGETSARGFGLVPGRTRIFALIIGVILCAVVVSATGPLGFVALVSPHLSRFSGASRRFGHFVVSAAIGAVLLLAADAVALHGPVRGLPVGVITAALGAPYFLVLLARLRGRSEL